MKTRYVEIDYNASIKHQYKCAPTVPTAVDIPASSIYHAIAYVGSSPFSVTTSCPPGYIGHARGYSQCQLH